MTLEIPSNPMILCFESKHLHDVIFLVGLLVLSPLNWIKWGSNRFLQDGCRSCNKLALKWVRTASTQPSLLIGVTLPATNVGGRLALHGSFLPFKELFFSQLWQSVALYWGSAGKGKVGEMKLLGHGVGGCICHCINDFADMMEVYFCWHDGGEGAVVGDSDTSEWDGVCRGCSRQLQCQLAAASTAGASFPMPVWKQPWTVSSNTKTCYRGPGKAQ